MTTPYDLISVDAAEGIFGVQVGRSVVQTHGSNQCVGEWCCIHNPSDHPLNTSRLNFRFDRGLVERICEHGVGHPDPDDLAFKRRVMPDYDRYAFGVHGCDGCCS